MAKKESENIFKRTNSLAVSEKRKIILAARQKMIDEVIMKALENVSIMSESDKKKVYFEMLKKACTGNGNEILTVNGIDMTLAEELIENLGMDIKISENPGDFAGGFILKSGNIEINMTFDMIVSHYKGELVSIASESLF